MFLLVGCHLVTSCVEVYWNTLNINEIDISKLNFLRKTEKAWKKVCVAARKKYLRFSAITLIQGKNSMVKKKTYIIIDYSRLSVSMLYCIEIWLGLGKY